MLYRSLLIGLGKEGESILKRISLDEEKIDVRICFNDFNCEGLTRYQTVFIVSKSNDKQLSFVCRTLKKAGIFVCLLYIKDYFFEKEKTSQNVFLYTDLNFEIELNQNEKKIRFDQLQEMTYVKSVHILSFILGFWFAKAADSLEMLKIYQSPSKMSFFNEVKDIPKFNRKSRILVLLSVMEKSSLDEIEEAFFELKKKISGTYVDLEIVYAGYKGIVIAERENDFLGSYYDIEKQNAFVYENESTFNKNNFADSLKKLRNDFDQE